MKPRTDLQFRLLHALFSDFARAFPPTTAAQWKIALCCLFPAFLAEAEGRPIPPPAPRESTMEMDAARMNELIEMTLWLAAELGVAISHDSK